MNVRILLFTMMLISIPCYANNPAVEKQVLKQTYDEIKIATERYETVFSNCKKKASRNIDVSLFKEIKLSLDDLSHALVYLSRKAQERCEKAELQNYFFTLSKGKAIYDHYGKAPPKEVHLLNAVHYSTWRHLELGVRFNSIPSKYRLMLEEMEELKSPFMSLNLSDKIEKKYFSKRK